MTTFGGIFTGALVLLALAFLTPLFYYIPDAALAAVIIMAVTDMINFTMVKHLWYISKPDLLPWFTAFFVSLGAGFEYGILLGVVVSLLILLYPWSRPRLTMRDYEDEKITATHPFANIVVIDVSVGLMFPGVEFLQEKIAHKAFQKNKVSNVVLDFRSVSQLDYTSALGIKEILEDFAKRKAWIVFINVKPEALNTLKQAEVSIAHTDTLDEAVRMIRTFQPVDDSLVNRVVVERKIDDDPASAASDDCAGSSLNCASCRSTANAQSPTNGKLNPPRTPVKTDDESQVAQH